MFGQSLLSAFGIACTTDTDQLFNPTPTQVNSLATYQLNNATTSIPSNTYPGTPSNITYTTGKFGDAAVFNGTSKIDITGFSNFGSTGVSISAWVNIDSFSNGPTIVNLYRNNSIVFGTNSSGNFFRSGQGTTVTSNLAMSTGTWYNVVMTADTSGNINLYLDGVSAGSGNSGTAMYNSNNQNDLIGAYGTLSQPMNGKIDQVRIFNSVLSQAAITALYNETTTTAQNAYITEEIYSGIAYYKMSDATDQLGNYNGTATNVNFNTEGKFGFAGYFNGSSSYIQIPNNSFNYSTMTFSAWVNPSANDSVNFIFANGMYDNRIGGSIGWYVRREAGGSLLARGFSANSLSVAEFDVTSSGGNIVPLNTWTNVVCVLTPTSFNIYINGSSTAVASATFSNPITYSASQPAAVYLGVSYYYYNAPLYESWWEGKIDQIRIYDAALSASDISTLYKEVECSPAAINALDHFNTVLYTGTGSSQAITGVGFAPDFIWIKDRDAANWHNLQNTITGATKHLYSNATNAQDTTSDGLTSFDSDGFTIGGGGGFGNNGNNFVAWNWKAPLANLSTGFNGSSSYITIAHSTVFDFSSPTTLSFWVNRNTTNRDFIIDKSSSGGWQFEYNGSEYVFQLANTGGGIMDLRATVSGTGSWEHIVITYDSNQVGKLYLNGVFKATDTLSGTVGTNTGVVTIGKYSLASGYDFDGKLAQVRFFNSTLSASEVADLYTEPAASNNTLNYPAGAGCIAAYPLQTDAVDLSGNYSGASSNVTFGQPGYLTGNTDGTIPSAVAVNTDAGFSIVKFTISNPVSSQTIGHGLGGQPELIISKTTSDSGDWYTFHKDVGTGKYLTLNSTSAETSYANGYSTVNSTVWQQYFRSDAESHVAYCFKSIPGYSKIGSYVGTGATGNFQYMGFQPRYVMTKNMQDGDAWDRWYIQDSVRGGGKILYANASLSEGNYTSMQFDSTGFTLNTTDSGINESGKNYIYLAIA